MGLLGKLLGPCGAVLAVLSGEFPARIGWLLLCNDAVWWIPFGAFLVQLRCRARVAGDKGRTEDPALQLDRE